MGNIEISEGVHVVIGGTFPSCNTLVIISDDVAVVDPGCSIEQLRSFLKTQDLELRNVDIVILSHIHPDHITHTMRIKRLANSKIITNEITGPLFDEKEKMKEFLGFHRGHLVRSIWEDLVNERMFGALDEGKVDMTLSNQEAFKIGNVTLKTLYTPGHLPDHMCLELVEDNLVFGADIDCTDFGPFYGHPNSSILEFRQSIEILKNGGYAGLISGHLQQPLVTNFQDALKSYELQIDMREDFVLMVITGGAKSVAEITLNPIIYRSLTHPLFLQFEKWMIEHHVSSLIEKELVEDVEGELRARRA
ncbi:MAG: MBL fold metallo-hydrolase [Candidatus Thorarchaeota archaeon]